MDYSKDPKLTSPDGGSEADRYWTLSSDERPSFNELFQGLDCLVLERSIENDAYQPIHTLPEWAHSVMTKVSSKSNQNLWVAKSDFLVSYILMVAKPWWDQPQGVTVESLPFQDAGFDFEVEAAAIGLRQLLVIKRGSPIRRAYLERMKGKKN